MLPEVENPELGLEPLKLDPLGPGGLDLGLDILGVLSGVMTLL